MRDVLMFLGFLVGITGVVLGTFQFQRLSIVVSGFAIIFLMIWLHEKKCAVHAKSETGVKE